MPIPTDKKHNLEILISTTKKNNLDFIENIFFENNQHNFPIVIVNQSGAITGFSLNDASNNGLPKPSPCVNET